MKPRSRSLSARRVARLVVPIALVGIVSLVIGVKVGAFTRHLEAAKSVTVTTPVRHAVATAPAAQAAPKPSTPAAPAAVAPKTAARPTVTAPAAAATVAAASPAPASTVSSLQPTATTPTTPAPSSSTSPSQSSSSSSAATQSTPTAPPPSARYTSTNWAGYAATTGSFTGVAGAWTVPSPTSTSSTANSLDAAWIGIGGVSTSDLIQTGTDDVVAPDGTVTVSAFYELLPASAHFIPSLSVAPGDRMSAAITQTSSTSWNVTITNVTTGQSYLTSLTYTSSLSSAEWIEEDPSYTGGSLTPFDNFGTVNFSGCTATSAAGTQTPDALGAASITLIGSHHQALATPSSVLNGAFSVAHS